MQFITSLFGGSGNSVLTALFALGVVLVLIVLGVWLLKFVFNASGNVARGRNRRLAVIDSLPIDQKRQLLIVRRDNVEHLILTGGQHDLVVETGIPVSEAPAQPSRRPIPTVAARKPAPGKPVAARTEPAASPAAAIEKLREFGPAANGPRSLRHTGLLRPGKETADNPDIADRFDTDSAKENEAQRRAEGTDFVAGNNEANRS